VQLIAFNGSSYSLLFVAIGFAVHFLSKRQKVKQIGQIVMGFGLIFFGMSIMSTTMEPLKTYPGVPELFASFGANPLFGLLVSTAFTAIIQGSAATIGIALSLSLQGIVPLEAAIPLILGANVGTCGTALLATIGAPTEAKRVGIAHVLFKMLGVILIMPFLGPFTGLVRMTAADITRQIANAHTVFNIGITLLFLPFAAQLAKIIERFVPEKVAPLPLLQQPEYLDHRSLDTPVIALEQVRAETGRVAQMVQQMTIHLGELFEHGTEGAALKINEMEEGVDRLYTEIIDFSTRIAQHNLTKEQSQENILWIQTINDLEHMADALVRMQEAVIKKYENQIAFSDEGRQELGAFFAEVTTLTKHLVVAIEKPDVENTELLAQQAIRVISKEQAMRLSHIRRLQARITVSLDTSPIHLDLTNGMRRLAEHALLIANNLQGVSGEKHDKYLVQPLAEATEAH
jgi:phosphate:Na+ symporter